jgi:hypothetical protein
VLVSTSMRETHLPVNEVSTSIQTTDLFRIHWLIGVTT